MQYASGGWYSYYTFDLLRQQTAWGAVSMQDFFLFDVLGRLPIGVFACTFFLIQEALRDRKRFLFWLAALAGAVAASLFSRMKAGGFDNVLLPVYLCIALFTGLAWGRMSARLQEQAALLPAGQIAGCLLLCIQFLLLVYNPLHQIPTAADESQQRAFVQYIAKLPGDVYVPYHAHAALLAGKAGFAHQAAVWDVLRGDLDNPGTRSLKESISHALATRRFAAIIMDGEWSYLADLDRYYKQVSNGFPKEYSFREIVGWPVFPTDIFLPRNSTN
jgi:hypothetical protein